MRVFLVWVHISVRSPCLSIRVPFCTSMLLCVCPSMRRSFVFLYVSLSMLMSLCAYFSLFMCPSVRLSFYTVLSNRSNSYVELKKWATMNHTILLCLQVTSEVTEAPYTTTYNAPHAVHQSIVSLSTQLLFCSCLTSSQEFKVATWP